MMTLKRNLPVLFLGILIGVGATWLVSQMRLRSALPAELSNRENETNTVIALSDRFLVLRQESKFLENWTRYYFFDRELSESIASLVVAPANPKAALVRTLYRPGTQNCADVLCDVQNIALKLACQAAIGPGMGESGDAIFDEDMDGFFDKLLSRRNGELHTFVRNGDDWLLSESEGGK